MIMATIATYLSFHLALAGAYTYTYWDEIVWEWEHSEERGILLTMYALFTPYIFLHRIND